MSRDRRQGSPYSRREFLTTASWLALGAGAGPVLTGLSCRSAEAKEELTSASKPSVEPHGTGLVLDHRYLRHTLGAGHPESPERLKAIERRLDASGLAKAVVSIAPSVEPLAYIKAIHPESHLKLVADQAQDESICRLAVSGCLAAVDAVCTGKVANAFCAVRPPGHHATDRGEYGFCFYNNVAIAARYAQSKYGLSRVLIVDWDFHHGNGTEWAFYEDPTVLFFSTHALYAFPQTGFADRIGKGKGEGFNINVPLPHAADDRAILEAFTKILMPAAAKFRPELLLLSAGFDSRKDDLLGDFAVTDDGFAQLTKLTMSIAATYSQSRVVSILEGGYNTTGLAMAVEAHVKTLLGA